MLLLGLIEAPTVAGSYFGHLDSRGPCPIRGHLLLDHPQGCCEDVSLGFQVCSGERDRVRERNTLERDICTYIHIHVQVYMYTYICMYTSVYICIYVQRYIHKYGITYGRVCGRLRVGVHINVHIYIYICLYTCMQMNIQINR